eukprot:Sspe_Gene.11885::Locus_4039_Transcript_1_1_Confidence_1.000_Length_507::g.11885::m.11885
MPIVRLLTDTSNAKAKLFVAVNFKDQVYKMAKRIQEKSSISKIDLWKIKDQKAADKAADPTQLELVLMLDPKRSWADQGIGDKDYVYVKKKGAKGNTPGSTATPASSKPSPSSPSKETTPASTASPTPSSAKPPDPPKPA